MSRNLKLTYSDLITLSDDNDIIPSGVRVKGVAFRSGIIANKGVARAVEDTSPVRLLEMLRRYSQASVSYLEENLFKHGSLRNAFSHGLFWYEDEQIIWIDNVNSPDSHTMPFIDLFRILREQTLFAQCFLWVGAKLLAEKFFEP